MTKTQHVHKFKRLTYKSGNQIFFCTLPDCTVKLNPSLALGKRTICWRCAEPFIMDEYSIRLAKPHCNACHRPKGLSNAEYTETFVPQPNIADDAVLSLSERLQQTINQANSGEEDI